MRSLLQRLLIDDAASERAAASVFVTSASADGDALNQWQHYAHEGGFAIGLASPTAAAGADSPVGLLQPIAQHDGRPPVQSLWAGSLVPVWLRVLYGHEEQQEAARLLIEFARVMLAAAERDPSVETNPGERESVYFARISSVALAVACCMKHRAFSAEKEVRLVSFPSTEGVYELHRLVDQRFAPYIELGAFGEGGRTQLPIQAIRVGQSAEGARPGLRRLLDSYGYGDVELLDSEVPIR